MSLEAVNIHSASRRIRSPPEIVPTAHVSRGSLARRVLNTPTTDWLSTLIRSCARRYSSGRRVQNCLYFFVQELVEDDTITIHYVKTQDQLTDIGTKHFSKHLTGSL